MAAEGKQKPDTLREERRFFDEHFAEWLKWYKDRWVVIRGRELIGHYRTAEAAYEEAVKRLGCREAFLIERVTEEKETAEFPAFETGLINVRI